MKIILAIILCGFAGIQACGQTGDLAQWLLLIQKNDTKAARALCTPYLESHDPAQVVEAHKCMANVILCESGTILLEGDSTGGGNLRGSYTSEGVDGALEHLNAALKLAPQDLTIHLGRLHLLEVSGRYSQMAKALDESCDIYHGKESPSVWIDYAPELLDLRQYEAGLNFMMVLDKHFPDSPDVLGNIGAFLDLLKRDKEAIPYLERAVNLAPRDPINSWDLARAYDYSDQIAAADEWYRKGLALMTDPAQLKESRCLYGQFVENRLHDPHRACTLEKSCPADQRTACKAPNRPKK